MTKLPKAVRSTTGVFGRNRSNCCKMTQCVQKALTRLYDLVAHAFGLSVTGEFAWKKA